MVMVLSALSQAGKVLLRPSCVVGLLLASSFAGFSGQVVLGWNPSPSTNVVGYYVYYGTASANYTNKVDAGSGTVATVSNLLYGVKYYFAATAYDNFGLESDYSTEVSTTIAPPNQPPTLDPVADVVLQESAGTQTVNLSGIGSGATNEIQTLTITATSSNPSLIPNPAVNYSSPSATGTLTFAPVAYGFGSATITVTVNDGGASNNVVSRAFAVTVNSVNQAPTLNSLGDVVLQESAGTQTVNLSGLGSGATNEIQTLTITATSSNPSLIPNPTVNYTSPNATGTLTFAPVAYGFGSATITVTVNDGGASNNVVSRAFAVTVISVNQAPTLNSLAAVVLQESAGTQTVNLSGIGSGATNEIQTLTITATSSNPSLIPNPTVNYTSPNATGTLTFAPVAYGFGSATITVTVNDGGASNNVVSRAFAVTVNSVNQAPTLDSFANVSVDENAGTQTVNLSGIGSGAPNENQTLVVTAVSSNPSLIPTPSISYSSPATTGALRFSPTPSASGTASISVTVNDGGASNNVVTRAFTVTVRHINQPPTISGIADLVVAMGGVVPPIDFTVGDAETAASSLALSASSGNLALVKDSSITFSGSGTNRTVSIVPEAGQTGLAQITVRVGDGTDTTSTSFLLTVTARPLAPLNFRLAQ